MTGGGTAGHVMPALALLPYWQPYFDTVCYTGQSGGVEERLATQAGLDFFGTRTIKFERKKWWKNAAIPWVLHQAADEVAAYLRKVSATAVFSKGGYCALPTVLAAHKLGIAIVCHESDCTVGLANRLSMRYTSHLLTSFASTPKGTYVGNPIRREILRGCADHVRVFGESRLPVVLVMGGSMGALAINRAVAEAMPTWEGWNVVNLYGRSPVACDGPRYYGQEYADNIADFYALADVVVCRAGANTLFELAALGKPTVMVPLPKGTSRGDQEQNARYFAERYGFVWLPQQDLTPQTLVQAVRTAYRNPVKRTDDNGDVVNKRIAQYVWQAVGEK